MSSAARRLLLLPVCALLMAATALVDPRPVQSPTELTVKEVSSVLRRTLVARSWVINEDKGNEVVATLQVRMHGLTVRFTA
jgi:hypothetical protein